MYVFVRTVRTVRTDDASMGMRSACNTFSAAELEGVVYETRWGYEHGLSGQRSARPSHSNSAALSSFRINTRREGLAHCKVAQCLTRNIQKPRNFRRKDTDNGRTNLASEVVL